MIQEELFLLPTTHKMMWLHHPAALTPHLGDSGRLINLGTKLWLTQLHPQSSGWQFIAQKASAETLGGILANYSETSCLSQTLWTVQGKYFRQRHYQGSCKHFRIKPKSRMCIFSVLAPIQIKHIGNMDPTVPVIILYNYFHLGCHK